MAIETTASLKQALDAIEQRNADLQTKKNLMATAISNKGVPTQGSDSLDIIINNIEGITTKPTIVEGDIGVANFENDDKSYGIKSIMQRMEYRDDYVVELNIFNRNTATVAILFDNYKNKYIVSKVKIEKYNESDDLVSEVLFENIATSSSGDYINTCCIDNWNENICIVTDREDILKLDFNFNRIFFYDKMYSGSISTTVLSMSTDKVGDIYIAFKYSSGIVKINSSKGIEAWSKRWSASEMYYATFDEDNNSYYSYGNYLYKYSPNGEQIMSKKVGEMSSYGSLTSISNKYIAFKQSGMVEIYSLEGDKITEVKGLSGYVSDIVADIRGDMFIISTSALTKIDSNFNLLWSLSRTDESYYNKLVVPTVNDCLYYIDGKNIRVVKDNFSIETYANLRNYK